MPVAHTLGPPHDLGTQFLEIRGWKADDDDDELRFYVPSTVFQSFRDDGRVNMKGSVQ